MEQEKANNNTIIINIGSSKCYLIKDTNLKEITNDNSLSYGRENEKLQASNESNNYKIDKGLGLQDSLSSYTARPRLIGNNSYDKLIFITNGTNNCLDDTKVKFIASTPNQSEILKAIVDETVDNQTVTTYPTENILIINKKIDVLTFIFSI